MPFPHHQAIRDATYNRWVIDPNYALWTGWWDLGMMVLLTVVLFVTPYEVAFLSPNLDALFVINRVFDAIFMSDLVINFFLVPTNPISSDVFLLSFLLHFHQLLLAKTNFHRSSANKEVLGELLLGILMHQ